MKNGCRTVRVHMLLSEKEAQTIHKRMSECGITNQSAYLRKMGIDGYIIVRRNSTTKRWHQIAAVGRYKTTYTDKKAKSSKKCYRYSVLAYKKVSGKIMVSGPSGYAAAVTKRNKKKNVYSVSVSNPANVSIVMAGSCAQTYLKFPSKAYSRSMRFL